VDIIQQISSIPLFNGLPENQYSELAGIAIEKSFNRGSTIFSEGDDGAGFYVVTSGRIKIFKLSPEGRTQILHILGPGEIFGEVPVFAGSRFPANAEAMEESKVLYFKRDALILLVEKNPSIAMGMLAILSRRLRMFATLIDDLSLKEVPGRFASYLLYLSKKEKGAGELELDITKGHLASLLGTIPETLSRMLSKMSAQGIIEADGPRIKITNREGLEDLASGQNRL
jgi:CRP/FNR family transcriptional regulator, dissimilatory nitrate respiration regulator